MEVQRYDIEPNGCKSCTFIGCTKETEDGGYLQCGYTWQDEYGECPPEANEEVKEQIENYKVTTKQKTPFVNNTGMGNNLNF